MLSVTPARRFFVGADWLAPQTSLAGSQFLKTAPGPDDRWRAAARQAIGKRNGGAARRGLATPARTASPEGGDLGFRRWRLTVAAGDRRP